MMNEKLPMFVMILSIIATVLMFVIGTNSSHMSELAEFSWLPIPLAIVSGILVLKQKTS